MADFTVNNQGTLFLLTPASDAARDWVADHLPADSQTWGDAIAVEHRYIVNILLGIRDDGLTVEEVW